MQVSLSKLEEDFLGDLSQDSHELWELYEFVRLHFDKVSDEEVLHRGNELLSIWVERGWLTARLSRNVPTILSGEQLLAHVNKLGFAAIDPEKGDLLLDITEKASKDVKWLGTAT
jgi:hypothetical protein